MASYRFLVQQLCGSFESYEFHHVPKEENEAADALTKLGPTRRSIPVGISLEHIKKPSIKPSPESGSIFIPADLEAGQGLLSLARGLASSCRTPLTPAPQRQS